MGFFISCTLLTKAGAKIKAKIDGDYKKGGNRNSKQVFACGFNGFLPSIIFIFHNLGLCPIDSTDLLGLYCIGAYIGNFSAANADTWSSEIGVFSSFQPVLLTKFKKV